jgi:nucleoid DNA-binding protein
MTGSELIKQLSQRLGQPQKDVKQLLKSSSLIVKEFLDKEIGITIPGFGIFKTRLNDKRKSFNPFHNKFVMLPPKRVVKFKSGSTLKNEIKDKRF